MMRATRAVYIFHGAVVCALVLRQFALRLSGRDQAWSQILLLLVLGLASAAHAVWCSGLRGGLLGLGLVALFTGLAEWLGTATGLVFGGYRYEGALGPRLLGVPLLVPLTWFAMTHAAARTATLILAPVGGGRSGEREGPRHWLLTGLLMVLWDLALDLNQVRAGRWTWFERSGWFGIPWSNFLSWFLVGFLAAALLSWAHRRGRERSPAEPAAVLCSPALFLLVSGLAWLKLAASGNLAAAAFTLPLWVLVWLGAGRGVRVLLRAAAEGAP